MINVSTILQSVLVAGLTLISTNTMAQQIKINQIGYLPDAAKYATVPETDATEFSVRDFLSGQTVYSAQLPSAEYDGYSGEKVSNADFSAFETEGKYYIQTGLMKSYPFEIKRNGLFTALTKSSLKGFYYWRASQSIDSAYAQEGKYNFARPMGHPDDRCLIHSSAADAIRKAGDIFAAPGGWYDAGDYNKYVVNAAPPVFSLLHAYELNPEYYSLLDLNIPESNNTIPDILDEVKYETDWLLCMQDPNDGGVYHKLSSKTFCGNIMPASDKLERYFIKKSTAATLDFAAMMAKTYRVFKNIPELNGYADRCLSAAKNAYAWAQKNPNIQYRNPADIRTGEYGDGGLTDELFYACAELFIATGEKTYWDKLNLSQQFEVPSWNRVETFGLLSLASQIENLDIPQDKKTSIRNLVIALGESYYSQAMTNKYRNTGTEFFWGGNGGIAGKGMVAYCAYRISGNEKLFTTTSLSLNYLLGQNALSHSFVTGFGSKYTRDPHDRRSSSDGIAEPIPGYVSGGANAKPAQDCYTGTYTATFPAKKFVDKYCSYSTNEIAINWNGPLVFIAGAIDAATTNLRTLPANIETNEIGSVVMLNYPVDINIADESAQSFILKNGSNILRIDSITNSGNRSVTLYLADTIKQNMYDLRLSFNGTQITEKLGRSVAKFDSLIVVNKCKNGPAYLLSTNTSADGTSINLTFSKKIQVKSLSAQNISVLSNGKEFFVKVQSEKDSSVISITTNRFYKDNIVTVSIGQGALATDNGIVVPINAMRIANKAIPYPPIPVMGETVLNGSEIHLFFDKPMKQLSEPNEITVSIKNTTGTQTHSSVKQVISKQMLTISLPVRVRSFDTLTISYSHGGLASEYDESISFFKDFPIKNTLSKIAPFSIDTISATTIQAEEPAYNNYVNFIKCEDTDEGLNAYLTESINWLDFPVDVTTAGSYMIQLRVASSSYENNIQIQSLKDVTITDLQNFDFNATGGEQIWITLTSSINLDQGTQYIRIFSANGLSNLNWIKIGKQLDLAIPATKIRTGSSLNPNPTTDMYTIYEGRWRAEYQIQTVNGECAAAGYVQPGELLTYPERGTYFVTLKTREGISVEKIIAQ